MTRRQQVLAVAIGLVLLLGLVVARHERRAGQPSGLSSVIRVHHVGLGNQVGYVELDLPLTGTPHATFTGAARATDGWTVTQDDKVGPGRVMHLTHDVTCDPVRQPPTVTLRTIDGRWLRVAVSEPRPVDLCDPLTGAAALLGSSTSLTRDPGVTLDIDVTNVSTQPVRIDAVTFGGFGFRGGLPVTIPGRDRGRPLRSQELERHTITLTFALTDCARARLALRDAVTTRHLERLPFRGTGGTSYFTVPGLESYLEVVYRRTCVR